MAQPGTLTSILLAFRPKTLTAALVPVLAGTALAQYATGQFEVMVVVWALSSAMFIQIGTNLINDWSDFKKGADTEERIGPRRATQQGWMSANTVFRLGMLSFVIAAGLGLPLVLMGGWPIVIIGVVSLFCGYAYTAGPFPLAYQGLGDLFVILFFGVIAVMGTYFLHTGDWSVSAMWLGLQIGFLSTALLAINNLRDIHQDRKVNKKTLAVRFGEGFARYEIAIMLIAPFLMNTFYLVQDSEAFWVFALPMVALPISIRLVMQVWSTPPSPRYNGFLAKAALVHLLFGALVSVAMSL